VLPALTVALAKLAKTDIMDLYAQLLVCPTTVRFAIKTMESALSAKKTTI
jgi:hypothetical protein